MSELIAVSFSLRTINHQASTPHPPTGVQAALTHQEPDARPSLRGAGLIAAGVLRPVQTDQGRRNADHGALVLGWWMHSTGVFEENFIIVLLYHGRIRDDLLFFRF